MNEKIFSDLPALTFATLLTIDPAVLEITHLYSYQPMCQKYLMGSQTKIFEQSYIGRKYLDQKIIDTIPVRV